MKLGVTQSAHSEKEIRAFLLERGKQGLLNQAGYIAPEIENPLESLMLDTYPQKLHPFYVERAVPMLECLTNIVCPQCNPRIAYLLVAYCLVGRNMEFNWLSINSADTDYNHLIRAWAVDYLLIALGAIKPLGKATFPQDRDYFSSFAHKNLRYIKYGNFYELRRSCYDLVGALRDMRIAFYRFQYVDDTNVLHTVREIMQDVLHAAN